MVWRDQWTEGSFWNICILSQSLIANLSSTCCVSEKFAYSLCLLLLLFGKRKMPFHGALSPHIVDIFSVLSVFPVAGSFPESLQHSLYDLSFQLTAGTCVKVKLLWVLFIDRRKRNTVFPEIFLSKAHCPLRATDLCEKDYIYLGDTIRHHHLRDIKKSE